MNIMRKPGYTRKIVRLSNGTVEVEEYYTNRAGNHDRRAKKEKATPEQARRAYIQKRMKTLRWLMNENFQDGRDALATFSWGKRGKPPDTIKGIKDAAAILIRRLREEYAKHGYELKYIYTVEIGPRGSRHIHMLISHAGELPLMIMQRCWSGVVDIKPLYTHGQYEDIANYFVKQYAEKTERTTGEELKRCFECSRNLKKPEITFEQIREKDLKKDIEPPEGMILEKASVRQGVCQLTGRPYRFYRLLCTDEKKANCAGATEKPVRQQVHEPARKGNRITRAIDKAAGWIGGLFRKRRRP